MLGQIRTSYIVYFQLLYSIAMTEKRHVLQARLRASKVRKLVQPIFHLASAPERLQRQCILKSAYQK